MQQLPQVWQLPEVQQLPQMQLLLQAQQLPAVEQLQDLLEPLQVQQLLKLQRNFQACPWALAVVPVPPCWVWASVPVVWGYMPWPQDPSAR